MIMKNNLFVYGTLMFPDVYQQVVGHYPAYQEVVLKGFERRRVVHNGEPCAYPALVVDDNQIIGKLIENVSSAAMVLLDRYEGEEYTRLKVNVWSGNKVTSAYTYIWNFTSEDQLGDIWDPEAFYKDELSDYLRMMALGNSTFCLS